MNNGPRNNRLVIRDQAEAHNQVAARFVNFVNNRIAQGIGRVMQPEDEAVAQEVMGAQAEALNIENVRRAEAEGRINEPDNIRLAQRGMRI